jgi:hypothetical protein
MTTVVIHIKKSCVHLKNGLTVGRLHRDRRLLCDECEERQRLTYLHERSVAVTLVGNRWVSKRAFRAGQGGAA